MSLVTAGRDAIAGLIVGSGTNFATANARLGVGNSSTATTAGMTDLQGGSKTRKAVDSAGAVANVLTFIATFTGAEANHAWDEVGVFNAGSGGTMLCRVVQALGTKASGTWVLTHVVTVAAA
jgi:hypothetical protein